MRVAPCDDYFSVVPAAGLIGRGVGTDPEELLLQATCVGTGTACGFQFAESVVVVSAADGVRQVKIAESLSEPSKVLYRMVVHQTQKRRLRRAASKL